MAQQAIVVKIYDKNSLSKEIREPVKCDQSWSEYSRKLRSIQQNINNVLTQLVENEKSGSSQLEIEEEDGSSEDETESDTKRKSDSLDSVNKKLRKRTRTKSKPTGGEYINLID